MEKITKLFSISVVSFIVLCFVVAIFIGFQEFKNYNNFNKTGGKLCVVKNLEKGKDSCTSYRLCELKHGGSSFHDAKYCSN